MRRQIQAVLFVFLATAAAATAARAGADDSSPIAEPVEPVATTFLEVHTHGPFVTSVDEDETADVEVWHYGSMLVRADNTTVGIDGVRVMFTSLDSTTVYCDDDQTSSSAKEPGHGTCGFSADELSRAQSDGGFTVVFEGAVVDGTAYAPASCTVTFDPDEAGAVLLHDPWNCLSGAAVSG